MTQIRAALVQARKNKGMTQQELADVVGISRAFLVNIERGKYGPSLKVAIALSVALGEEVNRLFFEAKVRKTHKSTNK